MGSNDIAQALKRETEAWNAHDADGVAACYAEDAVLTDVGLPDPVRGRAAIRDSVAGYLAAFSDFRAEDVGEPIVSGNRAAKQIQPYERQRTNSHTRLPWADRTLHLTARPPWKERRAH